MKKNEISTILIYHTGQYISGNSTKTQTDLAILMYGNRDEYSKIEATVRSSFYDGLWIHRPLYPGNKKYLLIND